MQCWNFVCIIGSSHGLYGQEKSRGKCPFHLAQGKSGNVRLSQGMSGKVRECQDKSENVRVSQGMSENVRVVQSM